MLKAVDLPTKQPPKPERKPGAAGLRAGTPADGDGREPATGRAEPNLRSQTQEDAGFARVRSREAGTSIV